MPLVRRADSLLVVVDAQPGFFASDAPHGRPRDRNVARGHRAGRDGSYGLAAIAQVPAILGFALGMVLVTTTAWKAGLAPAWLPVLLVAGIVVGFAGPPAMIVVSSVVILIAYAIVARGILRRSAPAPRPIAVPVPA